MTTWCRRRPVAPPALAAAGALLLAGGATGCAPQAAGPRPPDARQGTLSVADFLPQGHVTDGSVSYQPDVQRALDATPDGSTRVFPPMVYRVDESGLRVHSRLILSMYGAVFRLDEQRAKDGQVFLGRDVADVQFLGGEVAGRNDAWPEGVNIRGVYLTGRMADVCIQDMRFHDLSSNGVGVFGDPDHPARDVWVSDVVVENRCNRYGDYLSERPGPEKGSAREDQGLIAFYHVEDFVVRGCRLERSRSDGTHFYRCRRGQFVQNKVYVAQMGGYFVESCEDVLAADNLVRDNGSRGVTIERGSRDCTRQGRVVAGNGREGLWAPNCTGLVVTGNVFRDNGRKPNGKEPGQVWNATITVNKDPRDPTKSPTRDYLIAHNVLDTTAGQAAAVRIDADRDTTGIVVKDNLLRGENRSIRVEGEGRQSVAVQGNE
jgi:hypothetical protein